MALIKIDDHGPFEIQESVAKAEVALNNSFAPGETGGGHVQPVVFTMMDGRRLWVNPAAVGVVLLNTGEGSAVVF